MYYDGRQTGDIFCSDETWTEEKFCSRFSQKNERLSFDKDVRKDDLAEELYNPIAQRVAGLMVPVAASAANGETVLKPQVLAQKRTLTEKYYVEMLG